MALSFDQIELPDGRRAEIDARPFELVATPNTHGDLEKVAAGGVIGAVLGGIVGGTKGAVLGGVAGAGTGAVIAVATRDNVITLQPGQRIAVHVRSPAEIPLIAQR